VGALTASAAIQSGKHAQTIPDPDIIPVYYMGEGPGLGALNMTLRQLPPQKPNAVLEQGVGRSHVTAWEAQDHIVHDNPDWYLGIGANFQPADYSGGGGGASVQTPIPISTRLALDYIQNHEQQSVPGASSQRTVIPARSVPNTNVAVLPR
jgi:hypothetical protein